MLKFTSDETQRIIKEILRKRTVINPHTTSGYWVRQKRGIAKICCPWGVSLLCKSPPMLGWGEVGLDINRCITVTMVKTLQNNTTNSIHSHLPDCE